MGSDGGDGGKGVFGMAMEHGGAMELLPTDMGTMGRRAIGRGQRVIGAYGTGTMGRRAYGSGTMGCGGIMAYGARWRWVRFTTHPPASTIVPQRIPSPFTSRPPIIHNRPMIYEPHPQHAPITPNHPPCDRGAIDKPVPPMPVGKPITRPTAPSSAQRPRYRHRRCYWRRARRCPPARHP